MRTPTGADTMTPDKKKYDLNLPNLGKELWAWLEMTFTWVPGMVGNLLRGFVYGVFFKSFRGKGVRIGPFTHIWFPWNIRIGEHTFIGRNAYFNCIQSGDLVIGRNVMIGPYAMIVTTRHNAGDCRSPMQIQGLSSKPVVIEDDVWIGGNSIILPGVTVGRGSIVSAAAVVTKNVPPFSVAGGNPAILLKDRIGIEAAPGTDGLHKVCGSGLHSE